VKRPIAGLLVCLLVAAGCGGSRPEPGLDMADQPALTAAPEAEVRVPEREPYRMVVGDVLVIKFFYYPEHNVEVTVRPDGRVTIPLVGEVMAAGMKPTDLETVIRSRYAEVVAEPEVAVIVAEFADQTIFVFGEVQKPGAYPLAGSMTLLDALARAGGVAETGKAGSVILMRRTDTGDYSGRKVDLNAVLGTEAVESTPLMPRDVIYVPKTAIAKVDLFVSQFFRELSPAWLFYLYGHQVLTREGRVIIGQ
jgi:polysaccharide export outer membrane protein